MWCPMQGPRENGILTIRKDSKLDYLRGLIMNVCVFNPVFVL